MVTKDDAVQLFETQELPNKLERRTVVYEWPNTDLQKLDDAITSLSGIRSDLFSSQLTDLKQTRERITRERSKELQNHLEIWGYISIDPDQLILDLLLPIKQDRRGETLERFVIDHCLNALTKYGEPEVRTHNGYVDINTPLLTLQQVGEIVVDLSRNPTQLRDANTSFSIYQRHPPLSETYQLTGRVETLASVAEPASAIREASVYEQSKDKVLEYLNRHRRASRTELVAYLTGAGLGNEKTAGSNVDIMNKREVIRNVGEPQYPRYEKGSQNQIQTEEAGSPGTRITGVWAVIDSVANRYQGRVSLNILAEAVIQEANLGRTRRGIPATLLRRYGAQHGYEIREEDDGQIVYRVRQSNLPG